MGHEMTWWREQKSLTKGEWHDRNWQTGRHLGDINGEGDFISLKKNKCFYRILPAIFASFFFDQLYKNLNNFLSTLEYSLIFFDTASVCHGLTFWLRKRVTRGVPDRFFKAHRPPSQNRRSYFFVKCLQFEPL